MADTFSNGDSFQSVRQALNTKLSALEVSVTGKSATAHNHSGVYEPVDATLVRQADVDDTPVNGATTDPISSNWAYDHLATHAAKLFFYDTLDALQAATDTSTPLFLTGRVSDSDGGEGVFVWDSADLSSEVTADTRSAIYVAPDSDATGASGAWVRQHNGTADVRWFGAVGDGATDSTAAFQAAITMAFADNDINTLLIPPGEYLSDEITIPQGENVKIIGEGLPTIRFTSTTADETLWKFEPTPIVTATPSADIDEGDSTITFASQPTGVQVGDVVVVETTKNLYTTGNTTIKAGILKEVTSVGTAIGIKGVSETTIETTDSPSAKFYRPIKNLTISGIRFEAAEDAVQILVAFYNGACINLLVEKCEFYGPGQNDVGLSASGFDIRVTQSMFSGFYDDTLSLGYGVATSGHRTKVDNCSFYGCKHAVASGSNLRVSTDLLIADSVAHDPQKEAFDFHGGCWHATYLNNTVTDMGKTYSTAGGFTVRGQNVDVLYNKTYSVGSTAVSNAISIIGPADTNIRIIGNIIEGNITYPIKGDTIDGAGFLHLEIKDNTIDCQSITSAGVHGISLGSKYIKSSQIANNTLLGLDAHGMVIGNVSNSSITGNMIEYGLVQAGRGIGFGSTTGSGDSDGAIITNNTFKPLSATAAACVRVFEPQNGIIFIGNRQDTSVHTAYRLLQDSTTSGIARLVQTGNINDELTVTATYDPASLADGAAVSTTVTVTDAALGDFASATFSLDLAGVTLSAYVSAANTVTVRFLNNTGGTVDLASGTITVCVAKNRI